MSDQFWTWVERWGWIAAIVGVPIALVGVIIAYVALTPGSTPSAPGSSPMVGVAEPATVASATPSTRAAQAEDGDTSSLSAMNRLQPEEPSPRHTRLTDQTLVKEAFEGPMYEGKVEDKQVDPRPPHMVMNLKKDGLTVVNGEVIASYQERRQVADEAWVTVMEPLWPTPGARNPRASLHLGECRMKLADLRLPMFINGKIRLECFANDCMKCSGEVSFTFGEKADVYSDVRQSLIELKPPNNKEGKLIEEALNRLMDPQERAYK